MISTARSECEAVRMTRGRADSPCHSTGFWTQPSVVRHELCLVDVQENVL